MFIAIMIGVSFVFTDYAVSQSLEATPLSPLPDYGTPLPGPVNPNKPDFPNDISTWEVVGPSVSPSPRSDMGLVYDSYRNVFVMVGGLDQSTLFNETWEYDGTTWKQAITANTPGARRRPAIAYDPSRRVVVLFGGSNVGDSLFYNDTWEYDGIDWVKRTVQTPPSLRNGAVMSYDASTSRMFLFGGYYYNGSMYFYNDTWEYAGLQWKQLSPSNSPTPRETPGFVYDPYRASLILFGGGKDAGSTVYNDTWEWKNNNWINLNPATSPPARWALAMSYDYQRNHIVMFGGLTGLYSEFNDTWEYDSMDNSWTNIVTSTSPPERWGHGMGFDLVNNRTVLFGGSYYDTNYRYRNDTWHYLVPLTNPDHPIVLIPGLTGSILTADIMSGCNNAPEELWLALDKLLVDLSDDHLKKLKLLPPEGYDASSGCNNIEATDIVYEWGIEVPYIYQDFYHTLMINLLDYGYDVTPCPYDWRRSIDGNRYDSKYQYDISQRIDKCVESARQGDPNKKVDILAHSLGGLVARQYILNSSYADKVHSVVTLGTPYWGAPQTIRGIRYGELGSILDPITDNDRILELTLNSPSIYQILPSKTYFNEIGKYFRSNELGNRVEYDYDMMQDLIDRNYNNNLMTKANNFHNGKIDDWRNDQLQVNYFIFYGSNIDTPVFIDENVILGWGGNLILRRDVITAKRGDGTVLEQSANLHGNYNDLAGNAIACNFPDVNHIQLTSDSRVWNAINQAFLGTLTSCSSPTTPSNRLSQSSESRELIVHGNARVHITDEQGRHTGPLSNEIIEENIPGVTYLSSSAGVYIGLPPVSIYEISIELLDDQPIQVKLLTTFPATNPSDIVRQTVAFWDVPSAAGGKIFFSFDPLVDPSSYQLNLDINGDGTIDQYIAPSDVMDQQDSSDITPPISQIYVQGQMDSGGYYIGVVTITLTGTDSGSGLYKIEYSIDGGKTGHIYQGPFQIIAQNVPVLYIQSTDMAGNKENPWISKQLRPSNSIYIPIVTRN